MTRRTIVPHAPVTFGDPWLARGAAITAISMQLLMRDASIGGWNALLWAAKAYDERKNHAQGQVNK